MRWLTVHAPGVRFAEAEALARNPPRPLTGDGERQLLTELARNSIAQRHWRQAVERLDAVLGTSFDTCRLYWDRAHLRPGKLRRDGRP